MAVTGKTGADSISKSLTHVCIVINKYRAKLDGVIELARVATIITDDEAIAAHAFLVAASATCVIWQKIASFSGF